MIQLNFLNAVVEDDGSGLIVNGKELTHIISLALGTIKRIPGRYDYLKTEDMNKPYVKGKTDNGGLMKFSHKELKLEESHENR